MARTCSSRRGKPATVLGEQGLALVPRPLGLVQNVFEVDFALVQRLRERLPGELPQHEQQADEDHDRPDRQRRLGLDRDVRLLDMATRIVPCVFLEGRAGGGFVAFRRAVLLGERLGRAGSCRRRAPGSRPGVRSPRSMAGAWMKTSHRTGLGVSGTHGSARRDGIDADRQSAGRPWAAIKGSRTGANQPPNPRTCNRMMISAKNVTPSISAAEMIMAVWMLAARLGLPGHALDGRLGDHADPERRPQRSRARHRWREGREQRSAPSAAPGRPAPSRNPGPAATDQRPAWRT